MDTVDYSDLSDCSPAVFRALLHFYLVLAERSASGAFPIWVLRKKPGRA